MVLWLHMRMFLSGNVFCNSYEWSGIRSVTYFQMVHQKKTVCVYMYIHLQLLTLNGGKMDIHVTCSDI